MLVAQDEIEITQSWLDRGEKLRQEVLKLHPSSTSIALAWVCDVTQGKPVWRPAKAGDRVRWSMLHRFPLCVCPLSFIFLSFCVSLASLHSINRHKDGHSFSEEGRDPCHSFRGLYAVGRRAKVKWQQCVAGDVVPVASNAYLCLDLPLDLQQRIVDHFACLACPMWLLGAQPRITFPTTKTLRTPHSLTFTFSPSTALSVSKSLDPTTFFSLADVKDDCFASLRELCGDVRAFLLPLVYVCV